MYGGETKAEPAAPPHLRRQSCASKENKVAGIDRKWLLKRRDIYRENKALRSVEGPTTLVFNSIDQLCVRGNSPRLGETIQKDSKEYFLVNNAWSQTARLENLLSHRNRVLIMSLTGLKISVFRAAFLSIGSRPGSVSLCFPACRIHQHSLVHGPLSPSSKPAMSGHVLLTLPPLWFPLPIPSSIFKDPGDYIGSTQIRCNLPVLKSAVLQP